MLRENMHRKLLRHGMACTSPGLPFGRINAIRALAVSLTLITFTIMIVCDAVNRSRRKQKIPQLGQPSSFCESMPPGLGPISVNVTSLDLEELDQNAFPDVMWGGQFFPLDCISESRVAIIVPYRDRKEQLPIFLSHMHQFLMKQDVEYGIYIIEQASRHDYFNRGKLLNVGFLESQSSGNWQCFIFHDIDLLPLDQRNIYSCPHSEHPRHHAAAVDRFKFKLPYNTMFSGVSAMTRGQFSNVDGFSNTFWGLNGENDDMVLRMHSYGYTISRYNMTISRYASLEHKPNPTNKNQRYKWYKVIKEAKHALLADGLSTLKYSVQSVSPHRLYTHIKADIGRSPTYPQLRKIMNKYKVRQRNSSEIRQKELDSLKKELIAIL